MKKLIATPAGRVVTLVVVLAMALLTVQAADAARPPAAATRPVAHNNLVDLSSRLVGTASGGRNVTGAFVPLRFVRRDGKVFVRGLVDGVVHQPNGGRSTFAQLRTVRVRSINGTPAHSGAAARARCDILHLVLAPLNLNLLGLRVHLDRVLLNIVAVTGAGNLLGNLLCAVTGLLDGGIGGALGRVVRLLNRILGVLNLG
jgi:hypothetical protein